MLRVLEYALLNTRLHDVQPIRIAVVEILMLLVDNDPSSIRSFVLKEHERPGKQQTLMTAIISAFHKEEDLGVKAQLAEAIRVLLLPPGEAAATEVGLPAIFAIPTCANPHATIDGCRTHATRRSECR
jgi:protein phosphatase-4 regulatory subunit 3